MLAELRLLTRMGKLAVQGHHADCTADYDAASGTYDVQFSPYTGRHGVELVSWLSLHHADVAMGLLMAAGAVLGGLMGVASGPWMASRRVAVLPAGAGGSARR